MLWRPGLAVGDSHYSVRDLHVFCCPFGSKQPNGTKSLYQQFCVFLCFRSLNRSISVAHGHGHGHGDGLFIYMF